MVLESTNNHSETNGSILLIDANEPVMRPLCRFRSPFSLRTGIFSVIERLRINNPSKRIIYRHPEADFESMISSIEGTIPLASSRESPDLDGHAPVESDQFRSRFNESHNSKEHNPFILLDHIAEQISRDLPLLLRSPGYKMGLAASGPYVQIKGTPEEFIAHETASFSYGIVVDTTEGPVIIDAFTEISAFTYIKGPVYIGKTCKIDNARISGPTIIGHSCRVGGEVENSIINDYTNKHHEGFLGHSILGSWVNIGAMATTSDLKNNYGEVRVRVPSGNIPRPINGGAYDYLELTEVKSGRNKLGSLIGDHAKIGIGVMINTGTVIDAGANIFEGRPPRYAHPFLWGKPGQFYEPARFLSDAKKIMARRDQRPPDNFHTLITRLTSLPSETS